MTKNLNKLKDNLKIYSLEKEDAPRVRTVSQLLEDGVNDNLTLAELKKMSEDSKLANKEWKKTRLKKAVALEKKFEKMLTSAIHKDLKYPLAKSNIIAKHALQAGEKDIVIEEAKKIVRLLLKLHKSGV